MNCKKSLLEHCLEVISNYGIKEHDTTSQTNVKKKMRNHHQKLRHSSETV